MKIRFLDQEKSGTIIEGVFFEGGRPEGRAFLPVLSLAYKPEVPFSLIPALQKAGINWFPAELSTEEFEQLSKSLDEEQKARFYMVLNAGGALRKINGPDK